MNHKHKIFKASLCVCFGHVTFPVTAPDPVFRERFLLFFSVFALLPLSSSALLHRMCMEDMSPPVTSAFGGMPTDYRFVALDTPRLKYVGARHADGLLLFMKGCPCSSLSLSLLFSLSLPKTWRAVRMF